MTKLSDRPGWWMAIRCECLVTAIAVHKLVERYGPDTDALPIARRLRCTKQCRQRPYAVALVEDPRGSPTSEHYRLKEPPIDLIGVMFPT